jgi:hypothetical protein
LFRSGDVRVDDALAWKGRLEAFVTALARLDELAVIVPSLFVSFGLVLYGMRGFARE